SDQYVAVSYATADGTATAADNDYLPAPPNQFLLFAPGETSKTVTVLVNGDTKVEPNETFTVNLSSPANASILKPQGTGTITNDDVSAGAFASLAAGGPSQPGGDGNLIIGVAAADTATTTGGDTAATPKKATVKVLS